MSSAAKYQRLGNDYHWGGAWIRGSYGQWVRRVLDQLPVGGDGMSILDAGCGDGYPASLLVGMGYQVIGVDELAGPLQVARERVPEASFSQEWPEEPTDYVLALEVLEHMTDPSPLVEAVKRCRQYAVVTTPLPGMDPYGAGDGYDLAGIQALFAGCMVEHVINEGEHQLYRIIPGEADGQEADAGGTPEKATDTEADEAPPKRKRRGRPRKPAPQENLL